MGDAPKESIISIGVSLEILESVTIFGFASALAVVTTVKHSENVEVYTTGRAVKSWLQKDGLALVVNDGSCLNNEPRKEEHCQHGVLGHL